MKTESAIAILVRLNSRVLILQLQGYFEVQTADEENLPDFNLTYLEEAQF